MPCVGIDSGQFYREELKRDQFDLFQIEFSLLSCCSIDRRERLGLKPLRITLIRINGYQKTMGKRWDGEGSSPRRRGGGREGQRFTGDGELRRRPTAGCEEDDDDSKD
jgi:hypothetical protein